MPHSSAAIMSSIACQITSVSVIYSTVYSGADQRKHQSSVSRALVREIHRWPVNSQHKASVTRKMFLLNDVIMPTRTELIPLAVDQHADALALYSLQDLSQYRSDLIFLALHQNMYGVDWWIRLGLYLCLDSYFCQETLSDFQWAAHVLNKRWLMLSNSIPRQGGRIHACDSINWKLLTL